MTVWPAIERELRAQARLGFTYGLRVVAAAALVLASGIFTVNYGLTPNAGGQLFGWLNFTLFCFIWMIVPLLAADCISCERREGTLGLLFMTPLKPHDIVLAKGLVHGLRALTLWLSVLPVLTIPFLLGGLGRKEALLSLLINFSSVCLALAAGLLASSFSKNWLRAQILAYGLGCLLGGIFMYTAGSLLTNLLNSSRITTIATSGTTAPPVPIYYGSQFGIQYGGPMIYYGGSGYQYLNLNRENIPVVGFFSLSDFNGSWGPMLSSAGRPVQSAWLQTVGFLASMAFVFLLAAIGIAASRLRRVWQEEPPSARRLWWQAKLFTPVVGVSFLKKWMRRKLARNPIGWLEQRSWTGRIVTWSWLAVVITLYSTILGGNYNLQIAYGLQNFMAVLLLVGLAASAAGSFHRERETGVMELLLVSPMSVGQIIGGRLRGLWSQFLPAIVLMACVWVYFARLPFQTEWRNFGWLQFYCAAFISVPVIGLFYSLKRKNFIIAFLTTLLRGLLFPYLLRTVLGLLAVHLAGAYQEASHPNLHVYRGIVFSGTTAVGLSTDTHEYAGGATAELICQALFSHYFISLVQLLVAAWLGRELYRDLRHRNFAFSRAVT